MRLSTSGSATFNLSSLFTTYGGADVASNGIVAGQGYFTVGTSTLTWTAVPEQTRALAGLLLGAGLLRRRRTGVSVACDRAIRVGKWKLLTKSGAKNPHPELYDLEADLAETTNLAAQHPEIVTQLTAKIAAATQAGRTR